jgi:hypothetical protein
MQIGFLAVLVRIFVVQGWRVAATNCKGCIYQSAGDFECGGQLRLNPSVCITTHVRVPIQRETNMFSGQVFIAQNGIPVNYRGNCKKSLNE